MITIVVLGYCNAEAIFDGMYIVEDDIVGLGGVAGNLEICELQTKRSLVANLPSLDLRGSAWAPLARPSALWPSGRRAVDRRDPVGAVGRLAKMLAFST